MKSVKSKNEMPFFGGSSLLVIFAVLCLTIFALMSLSTIQAEERLVNASEKSVVQYYEADCAAEKIFAALREGSMPAEVTADGNIYSYTCPISESQQLSVKLEKLAGDEWLVAQWKSESTAEWTPDDSIVLFDPLTFAGK